MAVKTQNPEDLEKADTMLLIPDYLNFLLTGEKLTEYTNASTTQLVSPTTKDWDFELIDMLGYPRKLFTKIALPKTKVGSLKRKLSKKSVMTATSFFPLLTIRVRLL